MSPGGPRIGDDALHDLVAELRPDFASSQAFQDDPQMLARGGHNLAKESPNKANLARWPQDGPRRGPQDGPKCEKPRPRKLGGSSAEAPVEACGRFRFRAKGL